MDDLFKKEGSMLVLGLGADKKKLFAVMVSSFLVLLGLDYYAGYLMAYQVANYVNAASFLTIVLVYLFSDFDPLTKTKVWNYGLVVWAASLAFALFV